MMPLAEIAPDYRIGQHGTAAELSARLGNQGIQKLNLCPHLNQQ